MRYYGDYLEPYRAAYSGVEALKEMADDAWAMLDDGDDESFVDDVSYIQEELKYALTTLEEAGQIYMDEANMGRNRKRSVRRRRRITRRSRMAKAVFDRWDSVMADVKEAYTEMEIVNQK